MIRPSAPALHRRHQSSSRASRGGAALTLALASLALIGAAPSAQGTIRYVTDGDTFRLESGERIRIAGIDAPETHRDQAKCAREVVLGEAAAARARAWLDHRTVTFERFGKSYNRTVARVTLDGRDVGSALVAMGVAKWWPRYQAKPDWCASAR